MTPGAVAVGLVAMGQSLNYYVITVYFIWELDSLERIRRETNKKISKDVNL